MKYILRKYKNNLSNTLTLPKDNNLYKAIGTSCTDDLTMLHPTNGSLKFFWLDSEKAAEYLSISVQTLRNLTSTSQVPYYKFGRLNRYRKDELDFCLLKNKRGQK